MKPKDNTLQTTLSTPRVIQKASCPTLTGSSELSYCIGIDDEDNILFLIAHSSGSGHFSKEWIAYSDVKACLPRGSITSVPLRQLFRGKSLNTSGFLLAALLAEGLISPMTGKRNIYSLCCDKNFLQKITALEKSGIDPTDQMTTNEEENSPEKPVKASTKRAKTKA
uniref:hypothetical protein n=1 Tax=Marinobacterium profundum TaxID=1714300 RepID=UPI00082E1967|nr:hypothetical protein [Marinobacterium profundum]